jgi:hypothetical protein
VYAVLSIQPKCHPPLSPYLPGGKREGNKCVVREDDDDIPRLCVSLAVFLFFSLFLARLSVKKNSLYCLVESSFFFLLRYICGKSKLPSLYTHTIIIIQCFVQRAKTSLDIYKFNYTAVHSDKNISIHYHEFLCFK